jgi:hypothetical protein
MTGKKQIGNCSLKALVCISKTMDVDIFLFESRFLLEKDETSISTKPDSKHNLPLSVFASKTEEDIGLLNKAAPRPGPRIDWDPDIVETLDDQFTNHDVVYTLEVNLYDLPFII